jgi:hypothetical protein
MGVSPKNLRYLDRVFEDYVYELYHENLGLNCNSFRIEINIFWISLESCLGAACIRPVSRIVLFHIVMLPG